MNANRFKHRCEDNECPFKGQLTQRSCGCHVDEKTMMLNRINELEKAFAAELEQENV